jgi:hypothetical protein
MRRSSMKLSAVIAHSTDPNEIITIVSIGFASSSPAYHCRVTRIQLVVTLGRTARLYRRTCAPGLMFLRRPARGGERWEKGKGCDIGYALAASSCEGANSVEACTVTAPDAITAFAVPNPNCPSQSRRFFQVWLPVRVAPSS